MTPIRIIGRLLVFIFRNAISLVKRVYSLSLRKNSKVLLTCESFELDESRKFLFHDFAEFRIYTTNAFVIIYEGRFIPVFEDKVVVKIKKSLKSGKNKIKFTAYGFFSKKSVELSAYGKLAEYETAMPLKKIAFSKTLFTKGSIGEIKLPKLELKQNKESIISPKAKIETRIPIIALAKPQISFSMQDLEMTLKRKVESIKSKS